MGEGLRNKEERGCEQGRQNSLWMAPWSHTLEEDLGGGREGRDWDADSECELPHTSGLT